jgi:cytochrome P450
LGIAHRLSTDPLAHFVHLYKKHGSIFRTNILRRNITVMAGLEANRFLNTDGNRILDSEQLFGSFGRELGTDTFLTAMDGEAHLHLRKQMKQGYSRSAMIPHLPKLIDIVDDYTRTLRAGDTFAVLPVLQRMVTQQLGVVIARRMPNEYFEHLQRLLSFNLNVYVMKLWPKLMMRLPSYQHSKAKVMTLASQVLEEYRENPNTEHPDLIDDLLAARSLDGTPYDQATLLAATIGPYFAGIDTVASSLSFFVYNVLKYPHVHEAATAESDAMFATSIPSFNDMKATETLHCAAIETLRIQPVAPFTPRHTLEEFEFNGYRIPAGSEIFFAQTVTHFLDEYFPNPYTFDPTRFAKGQGKGVQGAFAPYTLGAHLCLGAGIAETQMILIMARLLHNLRLELANPDAPLKIIATPIPNIGRDFRVRVVENRRP